jgi:TusA-related sulfurtransferase
MFSVDFLPAQDPVWLDPVFQDIVALPHSSAELQAPAKIEGDGTTQLGTTVPSDYKWALDTSDKGQFITVSTNNLMATTNCSDCYQQSSVFGDVAMEAGTWCWKVKLLNLIGTKQVCFGVARKPFDHNNPRPYKMMWGWSSNGCALPSYETRNEEAKMHSGEEVWLKFDADKGRIEAYWPATGMSGNIDVGTRALGKQMYPIFVLGRRGNTLEIEPVPQWVIED